MEYLLTIKRIKYYFGGIIKEEIIFNDVVQSKKQSKIPEATSKQIKLMQRLGIPFNYNMNRFDCSRVIKDRLNN